MQRFAHISLTVGTRFMKALLLLSLFVSGALYMPTAKAQSEPEYLMEIGAGVGLMSYEGDFNGSILKNMSPSASIVWRRLLNPRQGFRVAFDYGTMKGSSSDVQTYYPQYQLKPYNFSNSLFDLNATYEYNFWPYGTGREYRGAKRLTPFIFIGLGATLVTGGESAFTANVPMGLGVKYKIGSRMNLNVEWSIHFSMSDMLDGVTDPYDIKSSGMFHNKDCYSALMVSLTYSFKEKCRVCHNSDE